MYWLDPERQIFLPYHNGRSQKSEHPDWVPDKSWTTKCFYKPKEVWFQIKKEIGEELTVEFKDSEVMVRFMAIFKGYREKDLVIVKLWVSLNLKKLTSRCIG